MGQMSHTKALISIYQSSDELYKIVFENDQLHCI